MSLKKLNEKGLGLIETLLALGVAIIIVTSMVSLAIFTLRSSLQNKLLITGTQLANQEVELVRAYRDSHSWVDFIDEIDGSVSANCFVSDCYMDNVGVLTIESGEQVINAGSTEEIRKSFRLVDINGDQSLVRVAVTVSWQLGSDVKFAHNYTELSDWRSQ
ncbi:hypothetical protein HN803_00215 [candidate division WWE3 bacterium]|jgi:Tfp pilus assembly protein PilV|nr:hypothetical protein [candidate division WWE3 bacterium]MBT7349209.1 hypothetical protein [candidate division WWE3 bacterium]